MKLVKFIFNRKTIALFEFVITFNPLACVDDDEYDGLQEPSCRHDQKYWQFKARQLIPTFPSRLENSDKEVKSRDSETDDQSRVNTPSINLDTMERPETDMEESNLDEDTCEINYSEEEEERERNHSSRVTFLLT